MYPPYFLLLILFFAIPVEGNHFRGGTITWKPMNNSITSGNPLSIMITQTYSWTLSQIGCNDSMIADQYPLVDLLGKAGTGTYLVCNASCSTSGNYIGNEVPITGSCVDYSVALDLTVSQRSDIVNLTSDSHFTVTFYGSGGWQTLALGNSSGWSLSSLIDVRVRSDNGLINTPPVATCISYISVPVNIQQTIQIPVLDADDDILRCRFASGFSECVNTCPPTSLPAGTTLSTSCVLTITGPIVGSYYLIAIQVEDFINSSSTTPMSSVPLQFLIYVYATPSCTLKPLLLSNINSSCQGVQVGVNFTMILTVVNRCGSGLIINDIATLSFPVVIKSALVQNPSNASLWSMKITWMPTASEVGSQVFCAVASNNASVQSDQYCTTFFVGLSSVPLCPGVTIQTTSTSTTTSTTKTTTRTTTSSTTSSSSSTRTTSSTTSSSSSTTTTSLTTTSSSSTTTSTSSTTTTTSSLLTSATTPTNSINWPLILGLSLLALALALCCALCCWYRFFGGCKTHRQRKKRQNKEWDRNYELSQGDIKSHHQSSKGVKSSSAVTHTSRVSSDTTVMKGNFGETSFIDNLRNIFGARPNIKTIDPVQLDQLNQQNILNNEPLNNRILSATSSQDSFASIPTRIPTVNVIKLPRPRTSSVNRNQHGSANIITVPPREPSSRKSHSSRKTRTNIRSAPNITVTKVRRPLSAGAISHMNHQSTASVIPNNLSRTANLKSNYS